ncbi:cytochrome P450 [Xylariales sp. PMI_506]|nr:cytochrome P450 [Xylariales sp. PMI_506]
MALSLGTLVGLAVAILLITQWLWPLYVNYRIAKRSGLPVVVSPFNPYSVVFMLFARVIVPWVANIIPVDGIKLTIYDWTWRYKKEAIFEKYGNTFALVTPGKIQFWCADPVVSQTVLSRRKDFLQSAHITRFFAFLGSNVFTSNHEDWARQRRLVAPQVNERISEVTWAESFKQASQLIDYMLAQPASSSNRAVYGLRAIAINVLMHVGYGESKPWVAEEPVYESNTDITYVDAISLCGKFLFYAAAMPGWLLRQRFMSAPVRTLEVARRNIPRLTQEMLAAERKQAAAGSRERANMLSMLVRFSDSEKKRDDGASGQYLTEDEISGNLFIFTAAGFDTTANTLGYAVTLLAAYPEWQEWVQQELDHVWSGLEDYDEKLTPDYNTIFPKLTRILAVMFETLRLYPAGLIISRDTNGSQVIKTATSTYQLEGTWRVNLASVGLHYDRQVWGPDYAVFRPSRWLTPESTLGDSHIVTTYKGSFVPWGGGPRVCPGMKMAQVEFTAVMSTLFRKCRVEPVVRAGETPQDARENLINQTEDSAQKISMQMKNPGEVVLKWYKR